MWKYVISSGALVSPDGAAQFVGYSGQPECKNDPTKCSIPNKGPIPPGRYTIEAPRDTETHGPFVLGLAPHPENEMFGRSAFLIHGDSVSKPGTASQGCVIQPRAVRERVWASGDRELEVVE